MVEKGFNTPLITILKLLFTLKFYSTLACQIVRLASWLDVGNVTALDYWS